MSEIILPTLNKLLSICKSLNCVAEIVLHGYFNYLLGYAEAIQSYPSTIDLSRVYFII